MVIMMGISERKERDKQEMRKLILDTAMKLFLEEGFGNVSIRRIADNIEYSPATIYLYFKDKDEILYALHTEGFDELFRRQQAVTAIADPRQRLLKHGEIYIRFALENPEYYNLMFIMRSTAKKITAENDWVAGRRSYEFFMQDVQTAIDAKVLTTDDATLATFSLWSHAHGVAALILRNRCPMLDQEKLLELAIKSIDFIVGTVELDGGAKEKSIVGKRK
jgi:AcrR family transcriptional regulator